MFTPLVNRLNPKRSALILAIAAVFACGGQNDFNAAGPDLERIKNSETEQQALVDESGFSELRNNSDNAENGTKTETALVRQEKKPEAPEFDVELSWQIPSSRNNGKHLPSSEIAGHAIVFFSEQDTETLIDAAGKTLIKKDTFVASSREINQFIYGEKLIDLVTTGSPNVVLVPAPVSSFEFEDLEDDIYYFAVSSYDWRGVYGPLSNTMERKRP